MPRKKKKAFKKMINNLKGYNVLIHSEGIEIRINSEGGDVSEIQTHIIENVTHQETKDKLDILL